VNLIHRPNTILTSDVYIIPVNINDCCAVEHLNFVRYCGNRFEMRWSILFCLFRQFIRECDIEKIIKTGQPLLKLVNICPSYCQNKQGAIFLWLTVYMTSACKVYKNAELVHGHLPVYSLNANECDGVHLEFSQVHYLILNCEANFCT